MDEQGLLRSCAEPDATRGPPEPVLGILFLLCIAFALYFCNFCELVVWFIDPSATLYESMYDLFVCLFVSEWLIASYLYRQQFDSDRVLMEGCVRSACLRKCFPSHDLCTKAR